MTWIEYIHTTGHIFSRKKLLKGHSKNNMAIPITDTHSKFRSHTVSISHKSASETRSVDRGNFICELLCP